MYWIIILVPFINLISFTLVFTAGWVNGFYGLSCFEQLVFHTKVPLEGADKAGLFSWCKMCLLKALPLSAILDMLLIVRSDALMLYISLGLLTICLIAGLSMIGFFGFVLNLFRRTDLYEKNYVSGKKTEIVFPEKKRNLIYIFAESMETTYAAKSGGGGYFTDLIPELTALARENVNFSGTDKLGGAEMIAGTGWTTGGMVAQTGGIPLILPLKSDRIGEDSPLLPGLYALGDILQSAGYEQELLIGSNAKFGGRESYFKRHGGYRIFDLNTAKTRGLLPQDYREFWGYEDEKLFQFAKSEIASLAEGGKPFNFTMLTVDTHHPKGYLCPQCGGEYSERLSNVIRCGSRQLGEFVDWIKRQPFYENTTVVIVGDHLSMAAEYIRKTYGRKYRRTVFNVFLNAAKAPVKSKRRVFTCLDLFPTTLSAMGVTIEGDRLGLGADLFSGADTLVERYGLKRVDRELRKQSHYVKQHILREGADE